jgi:chemotaxis protein methyltransferase CheR
MELSASAHRILAGLLETKTGQQLAPGRHWWIETALKPLLKARGLESFDALVGALVVKRDSELATAVIEALLNNETFFFRDASVFTTLVDQAIARIVPERESTRRLRIWCAGCSTGQEVWSLAMMFAEHPVRWPGGPVEIVGTDVSASAIAQARSGIYSQREVQRGLPIRQLMRWFVQEGEDWRVVPQLHPHVRFQQQALAERPPRPGVFDVVLCRNVLLYFAAPTRQRVFDVLASAIAPDGVLMLGAGETVLGQTDKFVSDPEARGLYRPRPVPDAVGTRAAWG